jgi:hypothetical protein
MSTFKTVCKGRGGLGIIVHCFSRTSHLSDGPDIVQGMYTSLSSSHLAALYAGASRLPISPLKPKIPLYCAPSLTNSPILLSIALSSRPGIKLLAPAVLSFPFAPNIHLQLFATLFLPRWHTTHLKAPRPFPVRTRSARTREAVC